MALPNITGIATIFPTGQSEEIELRYTPNGVAVSNFTAAFQKSVKDQNGQWENKGKINVRVTAFGALAEHVASTLNPKDRVPITLRDVELAEFTGRDGSPGKSVQGILDTVGAPIERRDSNGYGNGGDYG